MARKVAECGTRSGYNKHARLREPYCEACKEANTTYYMEKYRNDPEYKKTYLSNQYKRHKERMDFDPVYAEKQKNRFHDIYVEKYKDLKFKQELKQNHQKWVQENPVQHRELIRKHSRIRRARIQGNGHDAYTEQQVLDLYGTNCHICTEPIELTAERRAGEPGWEKGLHIDHLVPISKGGGDTLDNVRPSHGLCNISKGATYHLA